MLRAGKADLKTQAQCKSRKHLHDYFFLDDSFINLSFLGGVPGSNSQSHAPHAGPCTAELKIPSPILLIFLRIYHWVSLIVFNCASVFNLIDISDTLYHLFSSLWSHLFFFI